jgi:glycosyltransferase involved in cell wall biosynthesis
MNKTFPKVSIIVTNYNYEKYLPRCIRSCLAQKNIPVEVIVIDDCSTDNSLKSLEVFKEDIKVISNKDNLGVAESANIGIRAAKSQFVVRVDADDFINSNLCFFMYQYLENNHDAFCVSCDYVLVDRHENVIERKYAEEDNISCGIMYRRDLLLEMGGYNSKMRHREEEELRKRLGEYYKIHNLRIPLYRYRMHKNNKTKDPEYKRWRI